MGDDMSIRQIPLTIIVAATGKNGIGSEGALPWPMLKKEMAYFARVTKRVPKPTNTGSLQSDGFKQAVLTGSQRNGVIMGRKTWESIPLKFRPLKDRTNIVISSQARDKLEGVQEDVIVAQNIVAGLDMLAQSVRDGKTLPLGRVFVIGGSSIYEQALRLPQTRHILFTCIQREYECDTFFPVHLEEDSSGWQRRSTQQLRDFVGEEVPSGPIVEQSSDGDVGFEFQLYERP